MRDSSTPKLGKSTGQAMSTTGSSETQRLKHQQHRRVVPVTQGSSWFSLPAPIRRIFDTFPLIVYDHNELPQRATCARNQNTLHIFTLEGGNGASDLSPNPACLKWQAFLLVKRIPFSIVSANNHASPTGALPFVLPAQQPKDPQPQAIPSNKIMRWAESLGAKEETLDTRMEAYMSLIDQNIRNAWLYHLYLENQNFDAVAKKLYVETASSNVLVQTVLANQLQAAAKEQLLRNRNHIDEEEIYDSANVAFKSLATALADQKFFSGTESPNLFDVTLFSYTHLLLSLSSEERKLSPVWSNEALLDILLQHQSLIRHRNQVLKGCIGG